MGHETPSNNLTEKSLAWENIRTEVDAMTDALGKPVDSQIKEAVIAIMAHEFPTIGSCEGHIDEGAERPLYPYVMVSSPEYDGWKESEIVTNIMIAENLGYQKNMIVLLNEFYETHNSPFDSHLSFEGFGPTWGFKLRSVGADVMKILTSDEKERKLALYRQEMDDFAKFLKNKFFAEVIP